MMSLKAGILHPHLLAFDLPCLRCGRCHCPTAASHLGLLPVPNRWPWQKMTFCLWARLKSGKAPELEMACRVGMYRRPTKGAMCHHAHIPPRTESLPAWCCCSSVRTDVCSPCRVESCSMRSVAAPRLIMPSFVIPVEYEDPAGCRAENPQAPRRRRDEPLSEYFSVLRSRS